MFEERQVDYNHCGNCKYFLEHFVEVGKKYVPLGYGHCIKLKRTSNRKSLHIACHVWSPLEEDYKEKNDRLENVLEQIAQNLNDIIDIIRNG